MITNTAINQSRYYHLTPSGWSPGTYVDKRDTLHEIDRPDEIKYTIYVYVDKKSGEIVIKTESKLIDYELINMLFDKYGNFPPNIANIP